MNTEIPSAAKIYLPFLTDVRMLRARARAHMEAGKVFAGLGGDPTAELRILNACLANEIVCVRRYERHAQMAAGDGSGAAARFRAHALEEQRHADRIAARIVALGGAPELSPDAILTRVDSKQAQDGSLAELLIEDLLAERVTVESYREIAVYFSRFDPATQQMMEEIRDVEEDHAEDLAEQLRDCTTGE